MKNTAMHTATISISHPKVLDQAVRLVRQGQVVGVPTDTVYGLACRFDSAQAMTDLYTAKARPPEKALPVLLGDAEQVIQVAATVTPAAQALMARFWPGALTVVLAARPELPSILTAGGATVAVRIPDHGFVRDLARQAGPLASSSANRSGGPNCQSAPEVLAQLAGRIPLLVDGGSSPLAQASTVLNLTTTPPGILREGPVGEAIRELIR